MNAKLAIKSNVIAVVILIVIPFLLAFPTVLLKSEYKNIEIVYTGEKNKNSYASDISIKEIRINEQIKKLDSIVLEEGWVLKDEKNLLANGENITSIIFTVKDTDNVEIDFRQNESYGILEIKYEEQIIELDNYSKIACIETIKIDGNVMKEGVNTFSLLFLSFLTVLIFIYFLKKEYQWIILLVASYLFYITYGIRMVVPIIITTVTTWGGGIGIEKISEFYKGLIKEKTANEKKELKKIATRKKRYVVTAVLVVNLGILFIFKYTNFFIENINLFIGDENQIDSINFFVPLGVSFYTFQSVGYLIDVYRGKYKADKNLFKFALFVSYFPQIIQGPISRYDSLAKQLFEVHRFDYDRVKFGVQRMLWGYFKKMVIADRVAIVVNEVFGAFADINQPSTYVGFTVFISVLLYGIQIYADFSGGMDIVVGISQILGIDIIENFRRPFMAKSVAEFWQRWHITLGSWMRDYVFYPLALSKPFGNMAKTLRKICGNYVAKVLPTCLASFIVFFLVGVWHGADWKYVIYGVYQAIFVSTATLLEPFYAKCRNVFKVNVDCHSWKIFQILRTILLVTIGRYLSRADSAEVAFSMMKATIQEFNPWVFFDGSLYQLGLDQKNFQFMIITIIFLFAVDFVKERGINLRMEIAKLDIVLRWIIYFVGIFSIIIFGIYGLGYDAGNFIYQGF